MDFKQLTNKYYDKAVATLQQFIRVKSVYDANTISEQTPYGQDVANALEFISDLAKRDNFNVRNIDNRAIEISYGDITKNNIAVFAHADVVPATGVWEHPPFAGVISDGYMYGRGTTDDKGPALAAYYALLALRDAMVIKGYSVRLVIGGDEERGSSCMHYYFNDFNAPAPKYGFTPDAWFPLIYAEKGIVNYNATKELDLSPLISVAGGEAANSVLDKLVVEMVEDNDFIMYLTEQDVSYEVLKANDVMTLTVHGQSAHGSTPELGVNAGIVFFEHFSAFYNHEALTKIAYYYKDVNGRNLNVYANTKLVGITTFNVGIINYENNVLTMTVNFRFPETVDAKKSLRAIKELTNMHVKCDRISEVLLFDPESAFIKVLLTAYQDETNDLESKPIAIGGGTYAKECPNTVAFGGSFSGRDGNIHAPNEYLLLDDYKASLAIYARAIHYLGTKL